MRALVLVSLLLATPAGAALSREVGTRTMPGVVFLVAGEVQNGKLMPVASGSGSILTPDGAILTNHHVIWDKKKGRLFDFVAVGLLKAYDQSPELTCVAIPARGILEKDLDLAVVKCERDLQGRPYRASGWPTIPVGSSDDLVPGASEIFVIGYPGVGGPTIHVTRGTVSGFLGKEGGAGRFWIKTDAAIAHGNSGGTAIDDAGNLVGIPTAVFPGQRDIGEKVGLIRPVELARPLLTRVASGWEPEGEGRPADEPPPPEPPPLATVACAYQQGVTVSGRVLARDSDAGVEGAFVVVLKPGVRRKDVKNDYSNLDAELLTYAISNEEGEFFLPCPVPRDQMFTVVVLAKGFVELSADEVLNTANAPDRFVPWGGKVFLQRAK
jgi:S1-C subfamily serine protease